MIRRDRRVTFETGGALAGQMSVYDAPSIAIFDADFQIPHIVNREVGWARYRWGRSGRLLLRS